MLEVACFTDADAFSAASAGASRIELCENYAEGGITPTFESLYRLRYKLQLDKKRGPTIVHVMIRPRGGNFLYSDDEINTMKRQIQGCRDERCKDQALADGVVFGALTEGGEVNEALCKELVELASPLPCTFHRAIDDTPDLLKALEAIARCGFKTVLSSGGEASMAEGTEKLKAMVDRGKSLGIAVMPGGGIRAANAQDVINKTGALWIHSAALVHGKLSVEEVRAMSGSIV